MKQRSGLHWIIVGLIAVDVLRYVGMNGSLIGSGATYLSTGIIYLSFIWLLKSQWKNVINSKVILVKVWLFTSFLAIVLGLVLAEDYWDYKELFLSVLGFSITPLFFYLGENTSNLVSIKNLHFKWIFWFGLLLIPIGSVTNYELYSRLMISVTFLLLLFPYVKFKEKILIVGVVLISINTAPDFRTFQVKIALGVLLILFYYMRKLINKRFILYSHSIIFILPFVFIIAAFYFDFNIFRDGLNSDEEYTVTVGENESNLLSDTRTFLYVETFANLNGYNLIFGKSAIGSYKSSFLGEGGADESGKRYYSEVGILNILLRNGLLGVIVYMLLLYKITRLAIKNCSSVFIQLMALLLFFRWPLTFTEEFTQYDLNFFFFWILLGFISNRHVQRLEDKDFVSIFS